MIKIYEAGYSGYSMSNNAVQAYEDGEMPLSKWTKQDILDAIEEIRPEIIPMISKFTVQKLKDTFLTYSSWHHTSDYYNKTDFYSIDEDKVESITSDEINQILNIKPEKKEKLPSNIRKGKIDYIVWTGTRKHPKANEQHLKDINIEERGSFYVVTDDNGKELVRKKIGSNGTHVTYYDN